MFLFPPISQVINTPFEELLVHKVYEIIGSSFDLFLVRSVI